MVSTETKARMSRGMLRTNCGKALEKIHKNLKALEEEEPTDVTTAQLGTLEGMIKRTRDTISKYEDAVVHCMDLEDVPEDKIEEDEHVIQKSEYEEGLEEFECRMDALKARIKEEKALAKAIENAGGGNAQTGTTALVGSRLKRHHLWGKTFH